MSEPIEACPWCGSDRTFLHSNDVCVQVKCSACWAGGREAGNEPAAIAAWNRLARYVRFSREALESDHKGRERLELTGGPRWFALDHKIGENVEGCSGCAALACFREE